jgi:hypothetical protein
VPTITFTNGWATDSEGQGGPPAWFGGEANATVDLVLRAPPEVVARNANATEWQREGKFYVGDGLPQPQRLPAGLPLLAWFFTNTTLLGNALVLRLNSSGIPPGQYPISIGDGVLKDYSPNPDSATGAPTLYGNTRVTAWLKIGPVPRWSVLDGSAAERAEGAPGAPLPPSADLTGEFLDPLRPIALAWSIGIGSSESSSGSSGGSGGAARAGVGGLWDARDAASGAHGRARHIKQRADGARPIHATRKGNHASLSSRAARQGTP